MYIGSRQRFICIDSINSQVLFFKRIEVMGTRLERRVGNGFRDGQQSR